jgi:hypothetical protein
MQVVDLVVVRERDTWTSKGSAFVWFATRVQAEQAILTLHMRAVLPDPSGAPSR